MPKIQILTVAELLEEAKRPQIPLVDAGAFRKAPREDNEPGPAVEPAVEVAAGSGVA